MSHTVTPAAVWHLGAVLPARATDVFGDLQSMSRAFGSHHVVPLATTFISWAKSGGAILAHRERPRVDGADRVGRTV